MLYERMLKEQKRLKNEIQSVQSQLQSLPDGKLICARNQNRYKWYVSDGHTKVYLPKKNQQLAEQLAAKKYLSALQNDLLLEKKAIDSYLRNYHSDTQKAHQLLTDESEYQKLLAPYFKPKSHKINEWITCPYDTNTKYPEQLVHKTSSGHHVRSKSEAMIATFLYMNKIPFRYECALLLGDSTVYPDFTILHPQTGELFYWEHFGRMDDPSYYKNVYPKLMLYNSHGIVPSIHLIMTFETKDNPLSSETIEKMISDYFL